MKCLIMNGDHTSLFRFFEYFGVKILNIKIRIVFVGEKSEDFGLLIFGLQ